ncbi:metal transporter [Shewanella sp. JM162201]|uniref:Metal transporter n=1 Tax=Shewanella jiangmenensis TaxID=2837387 RepID=A0ABS5V5C0_9GAMM|nr:metal transporter [Shewanella jiangmenensis]MBT1445040.1 metal transporter [Shewanella jiangmenensis]
MLYLLASCIALLLGPLCYRFIAQGNGLQKGLDGFIFVSLGGLVLIHILPELLAHGGLWSLLFVVLGLWGPTASEKLFHRYSDLTHNLTLVLGIGGLLLHTITDGGAMALASHDSSSTLLALGVVLHRLPVGLAIWWLLRPQLGVGWTMLVLLGMMLMTSLGFFGGEQIIERLSLENTVYLQAFVTGSILHVVLHQPHGQSSLDDHSHEYQAGIGSLIGIALLFVLLAVADGGHSHEHHGSEQLLHWLMQLSPALLLAYLVAVMRFKLGVRPDTGKPALFWLQRLAGPEALVLTALILGPIYALAQGIGLLLIGAVLVHFKVKPVDPHSHLPGSALKFGFSHLVDRSAPWVLLSLLLANLIGHPSVPLSNLWLQLLVLTLVLLPMRFCNLGGAVLAISLAFSGWSAAAVMLVLLGAPWLSLRQLSQMPLNVKVIMGLLLAALLAAASAIAPTHAPLTHAPLIALPHELELAALAVLSLLFAASLLRLGPRKFLRRLWHGRPKKAHHHPHQGHGHKHGQPHSHGNDHGHHHH